MFVPVPTVEVFIPWKNTWYSLPDLPTFTDDHGGERNMTDTKLMTLDGSRPYLVGGAWIDMNTGHGRYTKNVWMLEWDPYTRTYHWTQLAHTLGRYSQCAQYLPIKS